MSIDLNGRVFWGVENYDSGDLNADTRFHYHQLGSAVWGRMVGGGIAYGSLAARLVDKSLQMRWHYVTPEGEVVSGSCRSTIETLADGRYRLNEEWLIDGPELTEGRSVIEEIGGGE